MLGRNWDFRRCNRPPDERDTDGSLRLCRPGPGADLRGRGNKRPGGKGRNRHVKSHGVCAGYRLRVLAGRGGTPGEVGSTFTLATEVAALVAAGEMFDELGDRAQAALCRGVADDWNQQIEEWTYVRGTATAKRCGVEGYYVRINPFLAPVQETKDQHMVIKHWQQGGEIAIGEVVSPDALALVRFGLRKADDPRILNTVRVIDAELRVELPAGPCWRRFTKDAYGEDEDGNQFLKTGRGRCWPLMEGFSHQGFLPEQVWDAEDMPEKGLIRGQYTGSAMPLTWAQAEYIKLAVSLRKGRIFDMPLHTQKRYLEK